MITGGIVGASVLVEIAMWALTARKWSKRIEAFKVDIKDQSPEAQRKSYQSLRLHYMTSVFP